MSASASISAPSSLSSTTRMRVAPHARRGRGLAGLPAATRTAAASRRAASGSRTMNSLPFPGPSLRADTEPPWRSTRLRTIVRPMPSPPCDRSSACRSCTNRSKMRGSTSGAMPMPVSRTDSTTSTVHLARTHDDDRPPGRRVLGRVGEQIRDRPGSAGSRRLRRAGRAAARPPSAYGSLLEQRARHLDRFRDDLGHLDDLGLQLDPAARDA